MCDRRLCGRITRAEFLLKRSGTVFFEGQIVVVDPKSTDFVSIDESHARLPVRSSFGIVLNRSEGMVFRRAFLSGAGTEYSLRIATPKDGFSDFNAWEIFFISILLGYIMSL